MQETHRYDRKELSSQLYNYKLIFDVNSFLLENNLSLKEQISQCIEELENLLNELDESGVVFTSTNNILLNQANAMLERVRGLIELMLSQDTSRYDGYTSLS